MFTEIQPSELEVCHFVSYTLGFQDRFKRSEAIDTDQPVALIVTKVIIDTDRWQVCNGKVY